MEISINVEDKVITILYKDDIELQEVIRRATSMMQHMSSYRMDIIPISDPTDVFSTDL